MPNDQKTTMERIHFSRPVIWLRVQWYNWITRFWSDVGRITVDDILKERNKP